jgi:hypothetical protein
MSFSGTVDSDFMKLAPIPDNKKPNYINFAATDFDDIKNSLTSYLFAVYPEDFNNFNESELGIMLLELVAYMGTVLSYKTDAVANENFIRTVKTRNNLQKLMELIGVKMKGPSSSSARGLLTWASADLPVINQSADPISPVSSVVFQPSTRTFSIPSPEDGAPVSFSLYKLDSNNDIEDIKNSDDSIEFYGATEADNATSTVFSNMALVEGALVKESGIFGGLQTVKTIKLSQGPVIEKSVRAFVTSQDTINADATGTYLEVNRLFSASGPTDKIFEVIYDDNFEATVVFGEGILGQAPPTGSNFTVTYRVGGGTRGNANEEAINVIATDASGNTWRLENSTPVTGGTNAETMAQARRYAPYTFKMQDRLVTLEDYQSFASQFISAQGAKGKGIAAVRQAFSSANVIDVYILEKATELQFQKASPAFKNSLLGEIEKKKMLTDQVVVNDGVVRTLDLTITLHIEREFKDLEVEIKRTASLQVLSYFAIDNQDFGRSFEKVELERKIFQIPQVRFAVVENVPRVVSVDFNEIIQLNNFSFDIVYL